MIFIKIKCKLKMCITLHKKLKFMMIIPNLPQKQNMSIEQVKSAFHNYRSRYQPRTPLILQESYLEGVQTDAAVLPDIAQIFPETYKRGIKALTFKPGQQGEAIVDALRVGCVLSGGQAAGGHNVIVGIYDYIKRIHKNSQLFGFLNGPKGIFTGDYTELTQKEIDYYRNRGGFDMICSGRDKIEKPDQFQKSLKYCESLKLDGLVVIGGDDSNTNAALLAQYFLSKGSNIKVIGCPKTIDGDLKNQFVEVSFGFDTACKTYSQSIGSIMADTLSSKKYYHFIRLMGRSASHISLQCALLTRPTYAFIGQQVQTKKQTLKQLVSGLVKAIVQRQALGRNYGVVLIPQGLIQFIPEMNVLISQINSILAGSQEFKDSQEIRTFVKSKLTEQSLKLFQFLPRDISNQLLLDRDPHGNVQVAKIQTQKFIIDLVQQELKAVDFKGKFKPLANYFGYEGRCAFPTSFDCDYCYSLGLNAGAIIRAGLTGLMSCVRNLQKEPQEWLPGGYPLVTMMNIEHRKGKNVPVIKKALVELDGPLFKLYDSLRDKWALGDYFNIVASAQYQFTSIKPYLAVPPSADLFAGQNNTSPFPANQTPFALITEHNLNPLSKALTTQPVEYPSILDGSPNIVFSEQLKFKTKQLKRLVHKQYPFLSERGHQIVTFSGQSSQPARPTRIGVSFNGRQSPGGHNIIYGLLGQHTNVIGFIGGNKGIFKQTYIEVNRNNLANYINQSGFHFLGRSSDKIRAQQQLQLTAKTCVDLQLDGLVLIGATHTLTDGALLSDYFLKQGIKTVVNCVPCSIDNNIHHNDLEVSVGFASSSHTYSTLISNLMTDASSNTKYWYFIRLMGRDPSHLTLQCALSTKPNYCIISEQVKQKDWDLQNVVEDIVRVVIKRHETGRNFGCILIPEGLPRFLPSLVRIKTQLDQIGAKTEAEARQRMSVYAREHYDRLPDFIRKQFFIRDDNNELALSQIETQKLLAELVGQRLKQLKKEGKYKSSFSSVCHFLGYQGRGVIPTRLDRNLAFTYGRVARLLTENGLNGYCTSARGLIQDPKKWFPLAVPISHIFEIRQKSKYGINKPIVESSKVDLRSPCFKTFVAERQQWQLYDHYSNPGPIQYFGQMKNYIPFTISLEQNYDFKVIEDIQRKLQTLKGFNAFGGDHLKLQIIQTSLTALLDNIESIQRALE